MVKGYIFIKVYQLKSPNLTHWKSKFIDGLPNLFAKQVGESLRKNDGININYSYLTYVKLNSCCINEGLVSCNDIKLKTVNNKEY